MIRIRRIERSDPLYEQAIELRERVLLRPVGFDFHGFCAHFPGYEERFEHFVAVVNHPKGDRVVGVVCLLPNHPKEGVGKLMQLAVDPQRQREGIGRRLVAELERRAFGELGLTELFCHSQEPAVPFYAGLAWEAEGEAFEEAGIPHYKMVFRAEKAEERSV